MKYLDKYYINPKISLLTCLNSQCCVSTEEKDVAYYCIEEFLQKYQGYLLIERANAKELYVIDKQIKTKINFNIFGIYEILYKFDTQMIFTKNEIQNNKECLEWLKF